MHWQTSIDNEEFKIDYAKNVHLTMSTLYNVSNSHQSIDCPSTRTTLLRLIYAYSNALTIKLFKFVQLLKSTCVNRLLFNFQKKKSLKKILQTTLTNKFSNFGQFKITSFNRFWLSCAVFSKKNIFNKITSIWIKFEQRFKSTFDKLFPFNC